MDAAELQELVRDRHQKTPEIHPPSDFYGHAATLKRYAGLPERRPLSAVVEHSTSLAPRIWAIDVRAPFSTFLCSGEARARLYEDARPGGRAVPIGPMIRYAAPGPPAPRPRGRLLVFPAHSTHYVRSVYDAPKFARTLAGYRDRFSEITVCLYWRDILDGADDTYRAEGFECVSAGHMFDPAFLRRLRHLIDDADTVASNQFGAYIPYALALGRPAWLLQQDVTHVGERKDLSRDMVSPEATADMERDIRSRFSEEVDDVTEGQVECLQGLAGFDRVQTPDGIRNVLEDAEERYVDQTTPMRRTWHRLVGRVARPLVARLRR